MNLENLSQEMRERVSACATPEEILTLAKEEGYELSDDELTEIAGGDFWGDPEYDLHRPPTSQE